jgi:hypothetical protein
VNDSLIADERRYFYENPVSAAIRVICGSKPLSIPLENDGGQLVRAAAVGN